VSLWYGKVPDKLEPSLYAGQQRVAYNFASPEHLGQNDNRSLAELGIAWEEPDGDSGVEAEDEADNGTD
jgi:hypothetical protein